MHVLAVQLTAVARSYVGSGRAGQRVDAVSEISLTAEAGSVVAIVGPSGCGKTTLLELICGLQQPDAGTVEAQPAALMAQRDLLLPWLSALDNACLALRVGGPDGGAGLRHDPARGQQRPLGRDAARELAGPWFERFGLGGFEDTRPNELSGGMRQRVAFLRTLLAGKPVLCLDEPFGALDALTRADMQAWLGRVLSDEARAGDPRTVVLVTHDVEEAVVLADQVVVMSPRPGRVVDVVEVTLPRPRAATDPGVVALRARALTSLTALGTPAT